MAIGQAVAATNDPEALKAEWLERLESLIARVKSWVEKSDWKTRRVSKTVTEHPFGAYKLPILLMEKHAVQAVLNPVGRFISGTGGGVDLYLAPAYDDIARIFYEGNDWVISYCPQQGVTASLAVPQGVEMVISEEVIRTVLDAMIAHD